MASGRVPKMGMMLGTVSPKEQAYEDKDSYILPEWDEVRSRWHRCSYAARGSFRCF